MARVTAAITISVDGFIAGPNDGPGRGLGDGGERLHNWVFGGPWSYADTTRGEPEGEDAAWMDEAMSGLGAVVCGRNTYEASRAWGGRSAWGVPVFVVTHRADEAPPSEDFTFVDGVAEAVARAAAAAGEGQVHVMGGGEVIRGALEAGLIEELTLIVAPLVLGGGKRLFEGFDRQIELEQLGARQSSFATFLTYGVRR